MHYGLCIACGGPAETAVVFKNGRFSIAADRGGEDRNTVAIRDIAFCSPCGAALAELANQRPPDDGLPRCPMCDGPAEFIVSGNASGVRCVGHIQQFLRPPVDRFYEVHEVVRPEVEPWGSMNREQRPQPWCPRCGDERMLGGNSPGATYWVCPKCRRDLRVGFEGDHLEEPGPHLPWRPGEQRDWKNRPVKE